MRHLKESNSLQADLGVYLLFHVVFQLKHKHPQSQCYMGWDLESMECINRGTTDLQHLNNILYIINLFKSLMVNMSVVNY